MSTDPRVGETWQSTGTHRITVHIRRTTTDRALVAVNGREKWIAMNTLRKSYRAISDSMGRAIAKWPGAVPAKVSAVNESSAASSAESVAPAKPAKGAPKVGARSGSAGKSRKAEDARLRQRYDTAFDPDCSESILCVCGHAYYRHFDTYENMRPVGCKYCHGASCSGFRLAVPPSGVRSGSRGAHLVVYAPFSWNLIVKGVPVPKGRPRHSKNGHTYTPEATRNAEKIIRDLALLSGLRELYEGPVSVRLEFFLPDRRRVDCDNLAKLTTDALNGIAFKDDSQIVRLEIEKHLCSDMLSASEYAHPQTRITVESWPRR